MRFCVFPAVDFEMLPTWKVIGFILYVVLYFSVNDAVDQWPSESALSIVFKLLPLMHLLLIVASTSMDDDYKIKSTDYRVSVCLGLLSSAVGDYCLTYSDLMLPALCAFGVAQLFYMRAFGLRPFGSGPCAASFLVVACSAYFFLLGSMELSMMKVAAVIYWCLMTMTCWRSMVQLLYSLSADNVCACLGTMTFFLYDTLFTLNKFHIAHFPHAPFWIMLAYYVAQLGITLSACNTTEYRFTGIKKVN